MFDGSVRIASWAAIKWRQNRRLSLTISLTGILDIEGYRELICSTSEPQKDLGVSIIEYRYSHTHLLLLAHVTACFNRASNYLLS